MQDDYTEQPPSNLEPEQSRDGDANDVERLIQNEERVNVASLKLPDTGIVPDQLKAKVCERVQAIRKHRNVSLRSLAQQLGGTSHEAILSQVLRRQYGHEDSDHIRRLNAWAEAVERRTRSLRPVGICETGIARLLRTGCDYAKSQNCIVLMTGPAGIGKSVAAKVYASEDMNCVYVRMQSTHISPTAFLRQLAEACRVESGAGRSATMDAIVARLQRSHRLLILDEWHLAERALYETVRDLFDVCEVPIALIGTEEVSKRVQSARLRKGAVWSDQFCSRIGWVLDLTRLTNKQGDPRPLFTIDEIREIFRSDQLRISREGLQFLQALSCSIGLGCLRMAQRCYSMAARMVRRDKDITASHLRKAFRRQAVPEGVDDSALIMQVEESLQRIKTYSVAMVG